MKEKNIGVLGIGNLLMRDDGFGVRCLEELENRYVFPDNVTLLDGGTSGLMLAPYLEDMDIIYMIDIVNLKAEPGSIHCFSDKDVRSGDIQTRLSPHQVGLMEILELCKLRGKAPERIEMVTAVPEELFMGLGLTPLLESKIDSVVDIVLERLSQEGVVWEEKGTDDQCTNSLLPRAC